MLSSLQTPITGTIHHMIINKPVSLSTGYIKGFAVSCKPNSSSHSKIRLAEGPKCGAVGFGKEEDEIQLPNGGLDPELMPKHVAVIMDGNRRWARNKSLPAHRGYAAGRDAVKQLSLNCQKYGVKTLSVFAFSTENWARPKEEIELLMNIFEDAIQSEIDELMQNDVRLTFLGNRRRLPQSLQDLVSATEERGKNNNTQQLVVALNYGGRSDITEATRKIATKVKEGFYKVEDIDETIMEQHLETGGIEFPCPDLLIRTSGELRVSNFMLWELAYTQMFFTNKLFPDFNEADLVEALTAFQRSQGIRK